MDCTWFAIICLLALWMSLSLTHVQLAYNFTRTCSLYLSRGHNSEGRMILDFREGQDGAPASTGPIDQFGWIPVSPFHLLYYSGTLTCLLF